VILGPVASRQLHHWCNYRRSATMARWVACGIAGGPVDDFSGHDPIVPLTGTEQRCPSRSGAVGGPMLHAANRAHRERDCRVDRRRPPWSLIAALLRHSLAPSRPTLSRTERHEVRGSRHDTGEDPHPTRSNYSGIACSRDLRQAQHAHAVQVEIAEA